MKTSFAALAVAVLKYVMPNTSQKEKRGLTMKLVSAAAATTSASGGSSLRNILALIGKVLGGGVAALFAWYLTFLIKYKFLQSRSKLPWLPGPTPLPGIGSLHLVGKDMDSNGNPFVHLALMDIGKKYNGIYGLWLGSGYTVVITKPSVAEEAFCTHQLESGYPARGELTTDRAAFQSHGGHHVPSMYIMTRDGKGIAMSTGAYHRKVRGRLVSHVTSKKVAEQQGFMVQEEVESVVCEWRRKVHRGEKIDNLTAQLKRESMNMAMRLLFGKRFGAHEPQDFIDLKHCVEYFFCNLSAGNPSDMIPALRVLPNKFLTEMEKMAQLRDEVLGRMISEHRSEFDQLRAEGKMNSRADGRGMIDQFFFDQVVGFEAKDENGNVTTQYLTEDETHVSVWDILFAMTDTTATTNEWLIYHMINNPEIQLKVHEELDRVVGPDRLPTLDDRENMPYFWAVIKEVMRFRVVSPVMAPHYAVEDMTLHDTNGKEFFVPRGAAFFLHGYSMGLDPELWENPLEFNPDRWFTKRNQGLDLYGQIRRKNIEHYKFIPFSLGPRMCPGYSFAKVAQFIQAAVIMHSFRWKLSADARLMGDPEMIKAGKLDMTETWGLTIMPQRHGEDGRVSAELRPAHRLSSPQPGDIDFDQKFLRRDRRQKIKLAAKEPLSHDTALLRFNLPSKTSVLGLPTGKHFKIFMPNVAGVEPGKWNGRSDAEAEKNEVERSYTPTSSDEDVGYVDLVVKFYRPAEVQRFPDGGKVTRQLDQLILGDEIEVAGPFGRVEYLGDSTFKIGSRTVRKTMVGLMCGGSGITPAIQVLQAALKDPEDETLFSLIYANQTEEDILLRQTLEDMAKQHSIRFKLHYTLDRPPQEGWKYSSGFIDAGMIRAHMPPVSDDTLILMCGPPPMVKFACRANLEKLGYPKESQVEF